MEENKNVSETLNNENTAEEAKEVVPMKDNEPKEVNPSDEFELLKAKMSQEETAELKEEESASPASDEEKKEEVKLDDVSGTYTPQEQAVNNAYFNPIRYFHDGSFTIDQEMEDGRKKFAKKISKSKIIDFVSVGLMVVAFAGVLLVTFLNKSEETKWVTWLVLGIALAIIVFSFVLTSVFNKKNSKITKEYLNEYEDRLNGYVLSDLKVVNPTLCVDAKINDQDVIQAHYFHTINSIQSRAIVEGKRNGRHFSLGEVAVVIPPVSIQKANQKPEDLVNLDGSTYVPEALEQTSTGTEEIASKDMTLIDCEIANPKEMKKRQKDMEKANQNKQTETATGLFGKFYSYDMSVHSEESFIICFMGNSDVTLLPSNLTGFKAVKVPSLRGNIVVYAIDPVLASKFFDEEGVKMLNSITPNEFVQSLFISVNSYGSKVGMNLSDDIMQLPVKPFQHLGAYDAYKKATDACFSFIDFVESKKA